MSHDAPKAAVIRPAECVALLIAEHAYVCRSIHSQSPCIGDVMHHHLIEYLSGSGFAMCRMQVDTFVPELRKAPTSRS